MSNILVSDFGAPEAVLDMLSSWEGRSLPVVALCKGGSILGLSEQSIRVALTRLVRQGKAMKLERGRYQLIPEGNELLGEIKGWYEKSQSTKAWNGKWIGVCDTLVARSKRTVWRRHQKALAIRGFRTLESGLHLRPDNLQGGVDLIRTDLRALGLAKQAIVFGLQDMSPEDEDQAMSLWDVSELERRYQKLLIALTESESRLSGLSNEEAAGETLILGRQAIRCIIQDPLLPVEISRSDLRNTLVDRTRSYQARARDFWRKIPEFAQSKGPA